MSPNDGVTRILNRDAQQLDQAAELEKLRRDITVLFTDIKGSTAYFEKFGDSAGLIMVHHCNTLLGKAVERHGGRVIKTIGDAVMAAFQDHAEAVAAAIEMQEAVTADCTAKPEAHRVKVRIGIHYGRGIVKSNDVFGDVVNVASRVEGAAGPEQILISDTLYQAVAETNRFHLRLAGRFSLKGKSEQRELFEVIWRDQAGEAPGSHSMIMAALSAPRVKYKLLQLRNDGRPGREFEILSGRALVGRTQCDFPFPNDEYMQSPHARLLVESGQLFLDPVPEADTFFSLIGSYRLQHGDVVSFGNQVLEFQVDEAALAEASLSGKNLGQLSAMLHGAVAEFISLNPDGKRYPIREQQTTWGRTKATYTFPTDTAMSRSHAKVYHRGEDFFLEDVGSTNGTFVLARERIPIPGGAILSIGGQRLRVFREEQSGKAVQLG
ncbi:MAG: FHA domain-containing protein [Acidobacteriia bacterium]|nr:FHA domain-containing protein [Terriglobia bacterium]